MCVACVNSRRAGGRGNPVPGGIRGIYGILNFPVDRAETRNKERKQNATENMKRALEKQKNQKNSRKKKKKKKRK